MASFSKPEACGQTVLPDSSVLIGQKSVENDKIQMRHVKLFLTMWMIHFCWFFQHCAQVVVCRSSGIDYQEKQDFWHLS